MLTMKQQTQICQTKYNENDNDNVEWWRQKLKIKKRRRRKDDLSIQEGK